MVNLDDIAVVAGEEQVQEDDFFGTLFADWQKVMAKDKSVTPDAQGHFGKYPSHNVCVAKAAQLIAGTGIAYYQTTDVLDGVVVVQTIITHASGQTLPTGNFRIPYTRKDPKDIATAIGWAKRLSLVSAFSLGTAEIMEVPSENPYVTKSPGGEVHLQLHPPVVPIQPKQETP